MRVGVMMNSLASLIISKTEARMVPFAFEDEMLQAVAKREVDAAAVSPASIRADPALVDAVNAALAALVADGTISGIYAKYGVEHRRP
jgi:polar amino acid transport system substrate-binding protein